MPGASIAIAKDGQLKLARGYGLANVEDREPVHADSLFRIASVSKPITAVATLRLVENDQLDLEEKVFEILDEYRGTDGTEPDPGLSRVTVRNLLQHSGGWDRQKSFDPMFISRRIEAALGVPKPVSCQDVITYMTGQALDFAPGTEYAYSNFGYCLLGRVIEEVTGQPYEEHVSESVLLPLGITQMTIGGTLGEERLKGEVTYYGYDGQGLVRSAMPGAPVRVPEHYGGFHVEALDAHGGWVASAIDLVRFASSADGSRPPAALQPDTVSEMAGRPDLSRWQGSSSYYGMGWNVRPAGDDANWWHFGNMPGSVSLLVRTHHGFAWAGLFNSRPQNTREFILEVDRLMWQGVNSVGQWPNDDLFPDFGYQ